MKISIRTTFEIEHTDGETNTFVAKTNSTEFVGREEFQRSQIKSLIDTHNEKVGAIERKLLK